MNGMSVSTVLNLPPLSQFECARIQEVAHERIKAGQLIEVLNDEIAFSTMDDDYEIVKRHHGQIMRALRNLDAAIHGDAISRDAVFTALGQIQRNIKQIISDEVEA